MSMGWGKASPADWQALKTQPGQDQVDPGRYACLPEALRHIEPGEGQDACGAYIVQLQTTEHNAEQWQKKQLDYRMGYHPNPEASTKPDGYKKMNEISMQAAKALIEAAGVAPQLDSSGDIDVIQTLNVLVASKPLLMVRVSHRKHEGSEYQELDQPQPFNAG